MFIFYSEISNILREFGVCFMIWGLDENLEVILIILVMLIGR